MDTLEGALDRCYDLEAPVLYFPIRHHSPACSMHLRRTMDAYKPDIVLIEGPADTNHLLPHIADAGTQAPVCIYYTCVHKEKGGDGETTELRTACYYPLLDFSPELVAIRQAKEMGIPSAFIDLPYAALSRLERRRKEEDGGKDTYYDDYYMARSAYIQRLCQKQGCRHYSELWEKLFEIGGMDMDSGRFVRAMLALCHFSRVEYPPALLEEEGNTGREAHMAWEIAEACREHGRVLVVTGGFHTGALRKLVQENPPRPVVAKAHETGSYLIPYSLEESDQLAGYASGMPYPAFYQQVSENIAGSPGTAFDNAVITYLVRIGGALRKKKEATSIADEIAALAQSRGLASLRDKPQQGVYELLDAVDSAYIKEDAGGAGRMRGIATQVLRGDKLGRVTKNAQQVPLLLDFNQQAERFRLKVKSVTRQEVTLDILAKPAHRKASAFFHRLDYLGVGFGERQFGPDYQARDTQRVREKWRYTMSARVHAALVDVSYLGGTVREAASSKLVRTREGDVGCDVCTRMLIDAAVMDLTEHIAPLLEQVGEAVARDGSFLSLAGAAANLLFLENARWLLDLPEHTRQQDLLELVYQKAVSLLPSLHTGDEGEDRQLAKAVKELHQIAGRRGVDALPLEEGLQELADGENPPPCLQGAAVGLLYASGRLQTDDALAYAGAYLYGSGEQMRLAGLFLSGLFETAWDILFAGEGFLQGLGNVLGSLDTDDFMALLPDLRLAFSVFTPTQIDRIGDMVAKLLGTAETAPVMAAVPEQLLALGRELDGYSSRILYGKEAVPHD